MADNQMEFLSNFLNIFSSGTAGKILKKILRNVPRMTLFQKLFATF